MPNINYILKDLNKIDFSFTDNEELDQLLTSAANVWKSHREHVPDSSIKTLDECIKTAIKETLQLERKNHPLHNSQKKEKQNAKKAKKI